MLLSYVSLPFDCCRIQITYSEKPSILDVLNINREMHERGNNEKQPLLTRSLPKLKILSLTVLVFTMNGSYAAAVVSLQLSGIKSNIFQLNSLRFTFQCLGNLPVLCFMQHSLKVEKKHNHLFLLAGTFNVIFCSAFYFASSFMPVGNLDGLLAAFYILISVSFDLYRGSVTKQSLVVSCIAIVGILFIIQPWNLQNEQHNKPLPPCHYISVSKVPYGNNSAIDEVMGNSSVVYITTEKQTYSLWLGYIFIVIAAVAVTIDGNIVKSLVEQYPSQVVLFWVILFEGFVSFIINLLWISLNGKVSFTFPSENYCLLFTLFFIVLSGISNTLAYYVYKQLHVSTIALSMVIMTLCLYISQRTLLSDFQPGHANTMELLGVGVIIFGTTLLPTLWSLIKKNDN